MVTRFNFRRGLCDRVRRGVRYRLEASVFNLSLKPWVRHQVALRRTKNPHDPARLGHASPVPTRYTGDFRDTGRSNVLHEMVEKSQGLG